MISGSLYMSRPIELSIDGISAAVPELLRVRHTRRVPKKRTVQERMTPESLLIRYLEIFISNSDSPVRSKLSEYDIRWAKTYSNKHECISYSTAPVPNFLVRILEVDHG